MDATSGFTQKPPGFESGKLKSTPKRQHMMSLTYKCTNCPGTIYSIKFPSKLKEPVQCKNCGTMNTRYKIKEGYLILTWYNIKRGIKNLWLKSTGVFVKDVNQNLEAK